MRAVKLDTHLKAPRRMRTLGDALASIAFEWSQQPSELRKASGPLVYHLRTAAYAIGEILGSDWASIPLHQIVDLDDELIRYALEEGCDRKYASRYASYCHKILAHAKAHGWTCKAVALLDSWEPPKAALDGGTNGCLQIIDDLIANGKSPSDTAEDDLTSWRKRAEGEGLSKSAARQYLSRFRGKMRAAGLESLFPLLDLQPKNRSSYGDKLNQMTEGVLADLDELIEFRAPGWVPDRSASNAQRPPSVARMIKSIRLIHGLARRRLNLKPKRLHNLIVPKVIDRVIEILEHDRHLLRQGIRRIIGPIHAIVVQHIAAKRKKTIFRLRDYNWMLDSVNRVPPERWYKRQARKDEKASAREILEEIPSKLRAESEAPGLSEVDVAWLRHDEAVISVLLELAFRQRNIRSSGVCAPATVNLVWKKITPKMEHELYLPDCVKLAHNSKKGCEFLMFEFSDDETKAGRPETVVVSMALSKILDDYRLKSRRDLVDRERDHGQLFVNRWGQPLSEGNLRDLVCGITEKYLEGKRISPHIWRDIYAAHMLLLAALGVGGGIELVQERFFQVDDDTTQSYCQLNYALPGIAALDREFPSRNDNET